MILKKSKFFLLFLSIFFVFSAFQIDRLSACDDSLLRLLTAENPEDEFNKCIIDFNQKLGALGTALKNNDSSQYEPMLQALMTSWLAFSNRYMVNPPSKAINDPQWKEKMQESAKMIGQIRKMIAENNFQQAHEEALLMNSYLGRFFENFGITSEKKSFLICSQLFNEIESARIKENSSEMLEKIASLSEIMKTLFKDSGNSSETHYQNTLRSLDEIKNSISSNPADNLWKTPKLLENAREKFQLFRTFIIANKWFPGISSETSPEKK
ncbi:MAG: hypothetical protein HQM10_19235 [Candidatus Riflebacteria bacterium]|nr:hypothetical protein [Candidatus Riflebacteria bacterium]